MSRIRAACPLAIALTRRSDGDLVLVASVLLLVAVSVIADEADELLKNWPIPDVAPDERSFGNRSTAFGNEIGCEVKMLHVMPCFYMAGILNTFLCPLIAGGCVILTPLPAGNRCGIRCWCSPARLACRSRTGARLPATEF